jgi:hypothetical protein
LRKWDRSCQNHPQRLDLCLLVRPVWWEVDVDEEPPLIDQDAVGSDVDPREAALQPQPELGLRPVGQDEDDEVDADGTAPVLAEHRLAEPPDEGVPVGHEDVVGRVGDDGEEVDVGVLVGGPSRV